MTVEPLLIQLGPVLDISQAEGLLSQLAELSEHPFVELDASQVERITTPCIQLMLSAARTRTAAQRGFAIASPSAAFLKSARDLGLAQEFSSWNSAA